LTAISNAMRLYDAHSRPIVSWRVFRPQYAATQGGIVPK
jgi:hypothetical protein